MKFRKCGVVLLFRKQYAAETCVRHVEVLVRCYRGAVPYFRLRRVPLEVVRVCITEERRRALRVKLYRLCVRRVGLDIELAYLLRVSKRTPCFTCFRRKRDGCARCFLGLRAVQFLFKAKTSLLRENERLHDERTRVVRVVCEKLLGLCKRAIEIVRIVCSKRVLDKLLLVIARIPNNRGVYDTSKH